MKFLASGSLKNASENVHIFMWLTIRSYLQHEGETVFLDISIYLFPAKTKLFRLIYPWNECKVNVSTIL